MFLVDLEKRAGIKNNGYLPTNMIMFCYGKKNVITFMKLEA